MSGLIVRRTPQHTQNLRPETRRWCSLRSVSSSPWRFTVMLTISCHSRGPYPMVWVYLPSVDTFKVTKATSTTGDHCIIWTSIQPEQSAFGHRIYAENIHNWCGREHYHNPQLRQAITCTSSPNLYCERCLPRPGRKYSVSKRKHNRQTRNPRITVIYCAILW